MCLYEAVQVVKLITELLPVAEFINWIVSVTAVI